MGFFPIFINQFSIRVYEISFPHLAPDASPVYIESVPSAMRPLFHRSLFSLWLAICGLFFFAAATSRADEADENKSIAKWLPRSAKKLAIHDPETELHVVVLGDSISLYFQPNAEESLNVEESWHRRFLEKLAGRFFFSGGVRDAATGKSKKLQAILQAKDIRVSNESEEGPKATEPLNFDVPGPAIISEVMARNGATASSAIEMLSTEALDSQPDLVLMMFGMQDVYTGVSLKNYRESLEMAVNFCKSKGVDVILAGPTLVCNHNDRRLLGLSRPYASVAKEVAQKAGILFLDSGAAQARFAVDETTPNSDQGTGDALRHIAEQYEHRGKDDFYHPNQMGHEIVGDALWQQLIRGDAEEPVQVSAVFQAPSQNETRAEIKFIWKIPSAKGSEAKFPAALATFGVDRIWSPVPEVEESEATPDLSAADAVTNSLAGLHQIIPFEKIPPVNSNLVSPVETSFGEELFLRGSVLVNVGSSTRLIDFTAPCSPLAIAFPVGRLEGLSNELPLAVTISNQAPEPFAGTAEVTWLGKTQSIPLKLPAKSANPLKISLPLPGPDAPRESKNEVVIRFKQLDQVHEFRRNIELARDVVLNQKITLANRAGIKSEDTVGMTCLATEKGLYFVIDLPPAQTNTAKNQPSATVEITLDARGPSDRGKVGYCEPLQLDVPWQDGPFKIRRIAPGVFGPGYDRELEAGNLPASVTTQRDNRRQLRLSIPSVYFYLHDWSLAGTRQNTLGLNVNVTTIDFADGSTQGTYPLKNSFSVVNPGMFRNDAQSLGVLHLAAKTPAWSARIY